MRFYGELVRRGLTDDLLTDAVHDRGAAMVALIRRVRGEGLQPPIVPIEGLE